MTTRQQFKEICNSMHFGNWTQAAEEYLEYQFRAMDLEHEQQRARDEGINIVEDDFDFVHLLELVAKIKSERNK